MKPNDYIIIIDDESPEQRVNRTNEKHSKRNAPSRTNSVAFIDEVDKVTAKKVKLKKHKDAEFDSVTGEETQESRAKRAARGEPMRRAYKCPREAFPLPRGMQATINWVSLDSATIEAIKQYDAETRP